jgi:hypothetical protein
MEFGSGNCHYIWNQSQEKKLKVINEAMPDQCSAVDLNVAKVEACTPLAVMPQIRGVKSEAVAIYCEPLTTKEMGYHRLSHGVNNTVKKDSFLDITGS